MIAVALTFLALVLPAPATPSTGCEFDVVVQESEYVEVCSGYLESITYSTEGDVTCSGGSYGTWVGFQPPYQAQQQCQPVQNVTYWRTPSFISTVAFVFNDGPGAVRFWGSVTTQ